MVVLNLEQGTPEWFAARAGVVTASRFKDIVTPAKAELSKSYERYMYELIAERLGAENEFYKNEYMERGNELEPHARIAYELISEVEVDQIGMIKTDDLNIGISPDGLVGDNGGLEIKCPKASTHVKYLIDGGLPLEYKTQVMGSLWVSEREWWDFMSYHPQIKPLVIRVYRDEEYIAKMRDHILWFVEKMLKQYEKVK